MCNILASEGSFATKGRTHYESAFFVVALLVAILLSTMKIEVHIPRPWSLLFWLLAGIAVWMYVTAEKSTESAQGGAGSTLAAQVAETESDMKLLRMRQEVLSRREEILRAQLEGLVEAAQTNPEMMEQWEATRDRLVELLQDKQAAEREIAQSFKELWEAQGIAIQASRSHDHNVAVSDFVWPVDSSVGISAHFADEGYQRRFGMPHQAIDIPVMQGTEVASAADGVVISATDNGLGFNSLVIEHAEGIATLYGHVSKFLVSEGDQVRAGDIVALSGGIPGTPGAGNMTTGAHLHFQMIKDGVPVDPLDYLPSSL